MSASGIRERAATFDCQGERLFGIVSLPERPGREGVLVVVGGPQYRAGSHRQFTLLCRSLAASGIAAMRFDCRGMGDAEGDPRTFEDIGPDIRAAVDHFCAQCPALSGVLLCGLCDAASATLFYAHADRRVKGIVLINPWARTSAGMAKAQLRHYYGARIADREFWQRLLRGEVALGAALRSAAAVAASALRRATRGAATPLPERMADGFARFGGPVLLVRSGRDLTMQEFSGIADASPRWRALLGAPRVTLRDLPEADHTFSRREWRDQIAGWMVAWARS